MYFCKGYDYGGKALQGLLESKKKNVGYLAVFRDNSATIIPKEQKMRQK